MIEEYFVCIVGCEVEVYVFNLVMVDQARVVVVVIDARVVVGEDLGLLVGVFVVLKDNMCIWGVFITCSSRILEGWWLFYDVIVVECFVVVGAVTIGKTNFDEFAMGLSIENLAFGFICNLFDMIWVLGGSSGGSVVVVVVGFVLVLFGLDIGGSIR